MLNSDYSSIYLPEDPDAAADGMIQWRHLDWDTEMLGTSCARIDRIIAPTPLSPKVVEAELDKALADMRGQGVRFVDCRVGFHAFPLMALLEARGFRLMDVLNIFLSVSPPDSEDRNLPKGYSSIPLSAAAPDLTDKAQDMSSALFEYGRLYNEPEISKKKANRFYSELMRFLCSKDDRTGEFLIAPDGGLAGFVIGHVDNTVPQGHGYLWLIGLEPSYRGQGLGALLLSRFLRGMHAHCATVEIGVNVANRPANRLYAGAGLHVEANLATFHCWLSPDTGNAGTR